MTPHWPENGDEKPDPALEPLIEAGEGESEGFELAEEELIEHASHGDQHSDNLIGRDALGFDSLGRTPPSTVRRTRKTRTTEWVASPSFRPARVSASVGTATSTAPPFEAWEMELHGHRVMYRMAGDGPPVVLIHGW